MGQNLIFNKDKYSRKEDGLATSRIRPRFLDFHKLSMNEAYEYPVHQHEQYEVIWIKKGPYRYSLNGEDYSLDDSSLIIIKPGDIHQDHLSKGQFHYVLHFSLRDDLLGDSNSPDLFVKGIKAEQQVIHKVPDLTEYFFRELELEVKKPDLASYFLQDSLMESFFWCLVREIPERYLSESFQQNSRQQVFQGKLYQIFEYLDHSVVSVDRIAEAMNVSRRTLANYCRIYFDESPARLHRKYVLSKGALLLSSTTLPIQQISESLGFENPFHFSRLFKQYYGEAPSQFRINKIFMNKEIEGK
jgi:AraC-like DNA-binding protein